MNTLETIAAAIALLGSAAFLIFMAHLSMQRTITMHETTELRTFVNNATGQVMSGKFAVDKHGKRTLDKPTFQGVGHVPIKINTPQGSRQVTESFPFEIPGEDIDEAWDAFMAALEAGAKAHLEQLKQQMRDANKPKVEAFAEVPNIPPQLLKA